MELSPGVIVGGNYQIEALVGTGGMGSVWRAKDLQLGRTVALKILHTNLRDDPQLNERFQREARLLASIEHPSIVPIYTWLIVEDNQGQSFPCIVMQLVKGSPLGDVMKRFGPMKLENAVNICRLLLDALAVAHEGGIIHRDLKPQNMVLEERASLTQLRLLDFGIARSISAKPSASSMLANQAGMLLGTPEYMSPEQISNPAHADSRADLWAAAVCFFEMLTAHLPYEGDTRVEIVTKVLTRPAASARKFVPALPRSVDDFFERAFAREIERRPRTAADMIKMLAPLDIGKDRTIPFMWPPPAETGSDMSASNIGTAPTSAPGTKPMNSDDEAFGATTAIPLVSQAQVLAYKAATAEPGVGSGPLKQQFLATRPSGSNVPSPSVQQQPQVNARPNDVLAQTRPTTADAPDALARTRPSTGEPADAPPYSQNPQQAWQPPQGQLPTGPNASWSPAHAQPWNAQNHPNLQQQPPTHATPRPWVMDAPLPSYPGAPQNLPPMGMQYGASMQQQPQGYPPHGGEIAPPVKSSRGTVITIVLSLMILLIAGGVAYLVITSH